MLSIHSKKTNIEIKRSEIRKFFTIKSQNIKSGKISTISIEDLELLYKLYDIIFFESWFAENFKGKLKFSLSKRMVKSAGMTLCPKNISKIKPEALTIEIRLGVDFLFNYNLAGSGNLEGGISNNNAKYGTGTSSTSGGINTTNAVCGINTNNALEALQLVFEHELCHVIEFINYKKSNCSKERFKTIATNLFGHTCSYHKLPTNRQIARQELGLNIGDRVSFIFDSKKYSGFIYNINKRATVMVRDKNGPLTDCKGNRYSKYYVPLETLMK